MEESFDRTLENMLCIIHGDGGHYIAEHGIDKAYDDALSKYYEYRYKDEAINPNKVRDWYAFNGGEELGITLEQASIVWEAALKSIENIPKLPNCQCGNVGTVALCQKCNNLFTDCLDLDV